MSVSVAHYLQRIPEGLPVKVRIEQEMAWIEEGTDPCSMFPVHTQQKGLVEGTYDATLEVARGGFFLMGEEIASRPLRAWLNCEEMAVRLVLNQDPQGGPVFLLPFGLEGMELAVRPTLPLTPGEWVRRLACLLPCHEVRLYSHNTGQSWQVARLSHGERKSGVPSVPERESPPLRDRFSELAAVLPARASARPFGGGVEDGRKQREDFEGFRMRTV